MSFPTKRPIPFLLISLSLRVTSKRFWISLISKAPIQNHNLKKQQKKNLNNSNEVAKQKLTANAQNSGFKDKNFSRTFTREQIGEMSGAEFAKHEPLIMDQLKKGLIQ